MPDFRYKAYLSYSHADHRAADWLHRALEAYRIPKRLRAAEGVMLPESLAPVFKDREDLSSASSLSETLQQALEQSEALLVICSPDAAASRWVNEEIRAFKALGRGSKIYCVIVEGDPQAEWGKGSCFPPALFEGEDESLREPLAADAREFADGKRLALLKVVAGLLGVPLDDLRRRDLSRRRQRRLVLATAAVAAVVLAGLALTAKLAEQQERAQAEQMAAFIVDLGEDLKGDIDLESLGRISATAMGYLEQLDSGRLSVESRIKVGKALRQVGNVNWMQGKYEEALEAFERSRKIFVTLREEAPDNDEVLFQLAQSEFYSGYVYLDFGNYQALREHWNRYLEIATQRHEARPDDPRWLLELSYATSNLINIGLQLREPVDAKVLADIDNNIELAGRALAANDGDTDVMSHYANELAFTADAQSSVCNLQSALNSRIASLAVAEQLSALLGASAGTDLDVALRNAGLAGVYEDLGETESALGHLKTAVDTLQRLVARDPSNEMLALDLAGIQRRLGSLLAYQGDLSGAREQLGFTREVLEPIVSDLQASPRDVDEFRYLVLDEVLVARLGNETQRALAWLDQHRTLLLGRDGAAGEPVAMAHARVLYRYERYHLTGIDPATTDPSMLDNLPEYRDQFLSCMEADLLARHGVMIGDLQFAQRQVAYLADSGFRNPAYLEFCENEGICDL